ncbi:MAG: carbamate kinase [Limnochordaceae bacterium]|nr:carbamate kinase [Limnochordaceae bacterium]
MIVVALGGNAILRPGQKGTAADQRHSLRSTSRQLVRLIQRGHRVVVTHGNGPQVGAILLQQEAGRSAGVPAMPLDVCGAQSQGLLGYLIQQSLYNELVRANIEKSVVTLVTQTVVDPEDPAFSRPTKPIGPFYDAAEARRLAAETGYHYVEDAGRGWRRVVPSPDPKAIVEAQVIRDLVQQGVIVVAAGGGGIPVVRDPEYRILGVEAVIDKDLAAARLAEQMHADLLVILTDVDAVYLGYGTPQQRPVARMTVAEARRYLEAGEFASGSMEPKVRACVRFVEATGKRATISALERLQGAVAGAAGTSVVP